jgi:hypothetical protein
MHASEAFVNGAGEQPRADRRENGNHDLLNTLLSGAAAVQPGKPAVQPGKRSADERQAEEESTQEPATKQVASKMIPMILRTRTRCGSGT